jgi:tryptophan-rich sensory protein
MIRTRLARTGGAVAATAVIGSMASRETSSAWYRTLRKPPFQPPAPAFPVVWTAIYATIATASATALERADPATARAYRRALAVNLAVNASWSWVFFKAHRIGPAVGVAAALTVSSADLTRRSWRTDRRAGWALLPYPAWCGFATVLTAASWRRNR